MQPAKIERQAQFNLIRLALKWQEVTGFSLSTLSRKAHNDPRFFVDLIERYNSGEERSDNKGSFTLRIYDRIVMWFADSTHWPDGAMPKIELADLTHTEGNHDGPQKRQFEQAKGRNRPKEGAQATRDGSASSLLAKLRRDIR